MTNPDMEPPFPFAGWLEEHPEGGFLIVHEDGTRSPILASYGELHEYLHEWHWRGATPAADVIRIRHVYPDTDPEAIIEAARKNEPTHPPPDD